MALIRVFLAVVLANHYRAQPSIESTIAAAAAFFVDEGLTTHEDYMPLLVRLAFHDCVGAGGCVR